MNTGDKLERKKINSIKCLSKKMNHHILAEQLKCILGLILNVLWKCTGGMEQHYFKICSLIWCFKDVNGDPRPTHWAK